MQQETARMKRRSLITIPGLALGLWISTMTSPTIVRAESPQNIHGTWIVTVTPAIGTPFHALQTFTRSGESIEDANASPRPIRTAAYGNWVRTGNRTFTNTRAFFRFDAARLFIGTTRVTSNIRLVQRDEFHAVALIENFNANGNPIGTARATLVGRRLEIVDFPEQP